MNSHGHGGSLLPKGETSAHKLLGGCEYRHPLTDSLNSGWTVEQPGPV